MFTGNRRILFVNTFFSLLIFISISTLNYPQITISQSEFVEIFTPGMPLYVIEGESGLINIGDTSGSNIYDFTFVNVQDIFEMSNYQVSSLPILAARYPSSGHTIGESPQNIVDNPVFYSTNDSTYFVGAATIENEYRFTHYVPYELYSKFPINYNSSFNQFIEIWDTTYDLSWNTIQASFYTSQQSMKVDGFGTLRLPGYDLECLRQRREYPDYGYKDFHFITREGVLLVVDHVPINEPNTGFVNGDYSVLLSSGFVDVEDEINIPQEFTLNQNYPNPFNPNTRIRYTIPQLSNVVLKVYDVLGNEIATLVNEENPAGIYEVEFNGHSGEVRNLTSGIYFYQLKANNFIQTKKMILLK